MPLTTKNVLTSARECVQVAKRLHSLSRQRYRVRFAMQFRSLALLHPGRSMARKDVGLMLETAGSKPMATLPGIAARMDHLIAAGHGQGGTSVMAIDSGQ